MLKFKTFVFTCFFASRVFAADVCKLYEYVQKSELGDSPVFWAEAGSLKPNDGKALLELIAKYEKRSPAELESRFTGNVRPVAVPAVTAPRLQVKIHKDAQKGIAAAPPAVKRKAEQLVHIFENEPGNVLIPLRTGGWQLERYRTNDKQWIVRLDQAYRAIFELEAGRARIVKVGKDLYNHGS